MAEPHDEFQLNPEAERKLSQIFERYDREMTNPEVVEDVNKFLLDVRDALYSAPHKTPYNVDVKATGDGWHNYEVTIGAKAFAFNASPILGPAIAMGLHHIFKGDFDEYLAGVQ